MTNQPVKKVHKKVDPVKLRNRKINGGLVLGLLILSIGILAAFIFNVVSVASKKEASGKSNSMSADTNRTMKNDQYEIGNNPTSVQKEYFQQLTDAINSGDNATIAEKVVYNFVADYFTWTNKDGNYEIGGLQYIYSSSIGSFEEWSRYNFYSDLDLYISQKGRSKLIEVKEITTDKDVSEAPDFTTYYWEDSETKKELSFESYEVNVSWTYASNGADTSNFPTGARFFVINNNGRWEIAEFYDYESINEWEAQNSSSDTTDNG